MLDSRQLHKRILNIQEADFKSLHRYDGEAPLIFLVGRQQVLRVWDGSPAVVTAVVTTYPHLLHVNTYFHEIAWSNVVNMGLARLDILGGSHIVLQFFRVAVIPLIVSVCSFFAVEIFYRVTQGIESDGVVGIDGQSFALLARPFSCGRTYGKYMLSAVFL